jgi:hypothetical protein
MRAWGCFGSPLIRILLAMGAVPFLYYCVWGRLWNHRAAHSLFFLPTTAPPIESLQRCVDAPCDALPTWAHFLRARPLFALSSMTRVLVLGAERDVVYAPAPLIPAFRARFANCTVTIAADQKHIVCRIQTATLLWTKRSLSLSQTNDNDIRYKVAECAAVQRLQKPQGIADLWLVTERRPCHSLVARRS